MKTIEPTLLHLNELQLKKHHSDLYDAIVEYAQSVFTGPTLSFREKFYIYYHELTTRPVCKWCGGYVNFWKFETGYKQFCSNSCSGNYKKSLPQHIKDETNKKRKQTCQAIYGVTNAAQSDRVKDKAQKTNIERYGHVSPLLNSDVKEKRQFTFERNWGVHPLRVPEEIVKRIAARKDTLSDRWAVDTIAIFDGKYEVTNVNLEKRSVEIYCDECGEHSVLSHHNIKQRKRSMRMCLTCNPLYSDKTVKNAETLKKYKELTISDTELVSFHNKAFTCLHRSKNHEFVINTKILYDRIANNSSMVCTICNPVGSGDSSHQLDIKAFLEEKGIQYLYNDKSVLGKKHLDFYIPTHNIAIEFNGVYWHSEVYKDKGYHLGKTLKCLEQGVKLVHVFEDDWIHKRDIVKSILLNNLNLIPEKLYARKCKIKEVASKEANLFLNKNHIQGACKSSIKYGLYHAGVLVSLMTFGYRKTNAKQEFELIRFCNLLNTNVVGASSRLFKHFLKNTNEKSILSYSDFSMFDGKMYEMLGFTRIHLSKPNYFWVVNGVRQHRYKFNKQKLIKLGFDPDKTEVSIMHERGFHRIWGCGQVRWVYNV